MEIKKQMKELLGSFDDLKGFFDEEQMKQLKQMEREL